MATGDSTTLLYNQEHEVVFKDKTHRYYVDGTAVPSVTTILSQVIAKPDLMLWPMNLALKQLEAKLPDITKKDLDTARFAHVQRRDRGSDTGTAVHFLVEKRLNIPINQGLVDLSNVPQEVALPVMAFESWQRVTKPKVVATEKVVYSPKLVGYAGTYDSILEIDGKTYLCDLKTSNPSKSAPKGAYAEHFIQLGAYYYAYEEQRQYELSKGKTKLVAIDDLMVISAKKNGVIDTVTASSLDLTLKQASDAWGNTYKLYNTLHHLKKQIVSSAANTAPLSTIGRSA